MIWARRGTWGGTALKLGHRGEGIHFKTQKTGTRSQGSPKKSWTVLAGRWQLQPQSNQRMDGWMDVYKCTAFSVKLHFMCRYLNLQGASMFSYLWVFITAHLLNPTRDCPRSSFSLSFKEQIQLSPLDPLWHLVVLKVHFQFIFSCWWNACWFVCFDWVSECREDKPSARRLGCEPMPSFRQNEEQARLMWQRTKSSCFRNSDMRIHGSVVCVCVCGAWMLSSLSAHSRH